MYIQTQTAIPPKTHTHKSGASNDLNGQHNTTAGQKVLSTLVQVCTMTSDNKEAFSSQPFPINREAFPLLSSSLKTHTHQFL